MAVTLGQYKIYLKICERTGLQPVSQDKCTIQLIHALKLIADGFYGTNIKSITNINNQ